MEFIIVIHSWRAQEAQSFSFEDKVKLVVSVIVSARQELCLCSTFILTFRLVMFDFKAS
jgi:hypothetical protein